MLLYFDYYSTTPIDKRVINSMLKFSLFAFGNPNSTHRMGDFSKFYLNKFRSYVEMFIKANYGTVLFTSGATESNNIALQGIIKYYSKLKTKMHVVCSGIEHDSVFKVIKHYESEKIIDVSWVYPNNTGIIDASIISNSILPNTRLVICMHVNNETGMINDIKGIGKLCSEKMIIFHVDAAQSYGKIDIDVRCGITSLSASAHKIYAPKGIGILYVGNKPIRVGLKPVYYGGGNQKSYKSGTIPLELCCAFYTATKIASNLMLSEEKRLRSIQLYVHNEIIKNIKFAKLNGSIDSNRLYNNLNYSFFGVEGESILAMMYKFCISTGSACNSENLEPSRVITNISGIENAHSSIRISFGRYTKLDECKNMVGAMISTVNFLKKCSPIK